tara:strand:- start:2005 stop:3204 length:1200 start_codon:yes stop_codon:yes gene_type:complete
MNNTISSFVSLKKYCEDENFAGWDPYDGLNSKVFNSSPFKYWGLARLLWIQGFKRNPINLRKLFLVPKEYNAKGIALFLSGYCNLYDLASNGQTIFGSKEDLLKKINFLAKLLESLSNKNFSGACWGYNFPWQSRLLFLFPKNTPTVVATSFCVEALFKAYNITKNENYKSLAISSADFIMNDLNKTYHRDGFLYSYSPIKGNDTVFNASLLGAKTLSICYKYSKNKLYKDEAQTVIKAVCESQEVDGSWVYGLLKTQKWKDSFHTGYNLDAIKTFENCTGDTKFHKNLEFGFKYYLENFFKKDGKPKYYNNKTFPIDIHCPAQLFVTLSKLNKFKNHEGLANKVMHWMIENMQDKKGYFYYQKKKLISSNISYMRWSNAFTFNAMSYFLKEKNKYGMQ